MSGEAPDYLEPILGWRAWLVASDGDTGHLSSIDAAHGWPVGEPMRAGCWASQAFPHPAPWRHCRCGIYAARDPGPAAFYVETPAGARALTAIGIVRLWGRVIEAKDGWRASHAYPERLYLPCRHPAQRPRLRQVAWSLSVYGVPIEILDAPYGGVAEALEGMSATVA